MIRAQRAQVIIAQGNALGTVCPQPGRPMVCVIRDAYGFVCSEAGIHRIGAFDLFLCPLSDFPWNGDGFLLIP